MRHILIANRATVAVHAAQVSRRRGYETTALAATADTQNTHLARADHAVLVTGRGQEQTYDSAEKVLEAVGHSGVDCVYPGYGALAENADFVAGLEAGGVSFVGPSSTALRLAGSKAAAVQAARNIGVAVLPHATARGREEVDERLAEIGLPAVLKPDFGEGGQGVRIVHSAPDVADALAAGGADTFWYIEKYVPGNRVIGVTLGVDHHGTTLPLGERESLLTVDGLKLLEASPVEAVDAVTLAAMRSDAARVAVEFGLRNVMTVEFIAGPERYYFLEVNGRLPLAYRMSEQQTGVDLIDLQFRIAGGEAIDPDSLPVDRSRHCLEARLFVHPQELEDFPDLRSLTRFDLAEVGGITWARSVDPARPMTYELILAQALSTADSRAAAAGLVRKGLEASRVEGLRCYVEELSRRLDELG
ncbi:biotin carboxylase N-terminal domain-containing protein [Streptomyces sp. NPDC005776]|uniref:ATP-binding protein n=1 Tax=Streptomyces sp. NPDC005776 TaxID=3154676 RepID=UPI0033EE316C